MKTYVLWFTIWKHSITRKVWVVFGNKVTKRVKISFCCFHLCSQTCFQKSNHTYLLIIQPNFMFLEYIKNETKPQPNMKKCQIKNILTKKKTQN